MPDRRPTVADLARAAGVSVATVDRVLNQRLPVRAATAARVLEAAERIGYHATALLRRRLREDVPARTLGFLLQKRTDFFYRALAAELEAATRAAADIRGTPAVVFTEAIAPAAIAAAIRELGRKADALAVVAVDHPHVTEAVAGLRERGVGCVALLSDLSAEARACYVGLDGRKAGRSAAWAIARTSPVPGEIGILVGSHRYLGHELAESGFRSYFREHAPAFTLLDASANLEDDRLAYEAVVELLARPRLAGIYLAGGGMAGAIQALRDEGAGRRIAMVCNELTPETRAALVDGVVTMVIATPLAALAAGAVATMARACLPSGPPPPARTVLPLVIHIAENI